MLPLTLQLLAVYPVETKSSMAWQDFLLCHWMWPGCKRLFGDETNCSCRLIATTQVHYSSWSDRDITGTRFSRLFFASFIVKLKQIDSCIFQEILRMDGNACVQKHLKNLSFQTFLHTLLQIIKHAFILIDVIVETCT